MARTKRNLFAMLGWVVWKILALIGLPLARKKLADQNRDRP